MTEEFTLIDKTNGDYLNSFVACWEKSFNRKLSNDLMQWIFLGENILYAVILEKKVIAGYCLYPVRIMLSGKIINGLLCNNVFVDPDYAGNMYFVKLGRFALKSAEKMGYEIAYGIPNENALSGHKRVGWTIYDPIKFLEIKKENLKKNESHKNIRKLDRYDNILFLKLLDFTTKVAQGRSFSIIKDKEYILWRYFEKPGSSYIINIYVNEFDVAIGYIVFKYYEPKKKIHVLDIECIDNIIFTQLVDSIIHSNYDFQAVNVWDTSIYSQYFYEYGFELSNFESDNLIFIKPYIQGKIEFIRENLNIVLMDNDVY